LFKAVTGVEAVHGVTTKGRSPGKEGNGKKAPRHPRTFAKGPAYSMSKEESTMLSGLGSQRGTEPDGKTLIGGAGKGPSWSKPVGVKGGTYIKTTNFAAPPAAVAKKTSKILYI